MEKSQETLVSVQERPAGARLQPAPARLEAETAVTEAAADPTWHWCPNCKLASMKAVACPSCGTDYVPVPDAGLPGAPHMPKVVANRSRMALAGSLAGAVALFGGVAASIFLLATHGANTTDSGSPSGGSVVDGTSAFSIGVLHGTLRLNGTWGTNMQMLNLPTAVTNGAKLKSILAIGKGSETLVIDSFPNDDPSTVLNQFVGTKPQNTPDGMGGTQTTEPSRDASIAGYTTVAQDFEDRNSKGGLVARGTIYAVNAGDQVVVIRISASPSQANDLAAIEQALINIG